MFAIGMIVIALAFIFGIMKGNHGGAFNWADRVTQTGVVAGTTMCFISLLILVWKLLP